MQCDTRLKKLLDEQTAIKNKLQHLTKKDSPSYTQKDLADLVYEKGISPTHFVNTYKSELMTTVLVVVPKKKVDAFRASYFTLLLDHNSADQAKWEARTRENLKHQFNN